MRITGLIFVFYCTLLLLGSRAFADRIHDAAAVGDTKSVVSEVARDGSVVNRPDKHGRTPLHIALKNKNTDTVKMLLSKGADPMIRDSEGKTALQTAIDSGFDDGLHALITMSSTGYIDPLIDIRRKEGLDAFKDGTLEKANEMLGRLVRIDPACEHINFAYGLSWLSLGYPAPSGAAFERVLLINPLNSRARTEMARARLVAKRYVEAKKELQRVLDADPPPDVQQSVAAFMREVRSFATRWYTTGSIELGGFYDDNVNVGPESGTIRIAPLTIFGSRITELTLSESSRPEDVAGVYLAAGARAFYDAGSPGAWLMTTDIDSYINRIRDGEYETGSVQAGIGLRRIINRGYLQIPFRARYIEYGGEPLLTSCGIYPSFVYTPLSLGGIIIATASSFEIREFDVLTGRNSHFMSISETAHKSFAGGRHHVYGGADVQHESTDSAEYKYTGAGVFAGGEVRLAWGIKVFGEMRYAYRNYDEKNILAPEDRVDHQYQFSAGISRDLNQNWSVMLMHNLIHNDSSFDLYEYQRQISTVSTRIKF